MSDCPNAEDPRSVAGSAARPPRRARRARGSLAHVDGCADCRSELELLRSLRGSLDRATPRVDVDRIVAALPTPASVRPGQHRRAWRVLSDWRIAAAVTFIVAGGTSVVVMRNVRDVGSDSASAPAIRHVDGCRQRDDGQRGRSGSGGRAPFAPPRRTPRQRRCRVGRGPSRRRSHPAGQGSAESVASTDEQKDEQSAGLANSRIGDLNAKQLKSLLNAIEHMDATPITEPEPVTLRVGAKASSPTGL